MVSPSVIVNPTEEFKANDINSKFVLKTSDVINNNQELEVTDSIISLSGLSYVSVDAESDNSNSTENNKTIIKVDIESNKDTKGTNKSKDKRLPVIYITFILIKTKLYIGILIITNLNR